MTERSGSHASAAERLLAGARRGTEPTAADHDRVRARLHGRALAAPLLFGAKTAQALATGAKFTTAKLLLALGVCGATVVVGGVALEHRGHAAMPALSGVRVTPAARVGALAALARPSPSTLGAAVETVPSTEAPAVAPIGNAVTGAPVNDAPPPAPAAMPASAGASASAAKRAGPSASAVPLSAQDMQLEIAGLRHAQQLLHAGDAAGAVSALDQLARSVPAGALAEERDATRVIALCTLGRVQDAAVDSFLARYPNSMHGNRVRSACSRASFE